MPKVLVTDGYWRKSLAIVRALAGAGIEVGIGERTFLAPAIFSKYAKRRYVYPSVSARPDKFREWLIKTVQKDKYEVLITPEEETALFASQNKEILEKYVKVPLADSEKIKFVRDKYKIISAAKNLGIGTPRTVLVLNISDMAKSASGFRYPFVMKPRIGTGSRGVCYIKSSKELQRFDAKMFEKYGEYMMQEYIPGDAFYGVSVLFNRCGKMRSAFVHKKIRQYPVTGGVSTYAESVEFPALVELSEKLLGSAGWFGVANVEFKLDERDNMPKLMEVNPRFWGSLHLAVASGVNFPWLLYKLAIDGDVTPVFDYKKGVKFRCILPGDILNFGSNLTKGKRVDKNFFKLFEKGTHHATFSIKDPLPIAGTLLSLIDYFTSAEMRKFRD